MAKNKDDDLRLVSLGERFPVNVTKFTVRRVKSPKLHHQLISTGTRDTPEERTEKLVALLDSVGFPTKSTVKETAQRLRGLGEPVSNEIAGWVTKERNNRIEAAPVAKDCDRTNGSGSYRSADQGTWGWYLHSGSSQQRCGTWKTLQKKA
jgi:hypothetical protein